MPLQALFQRINDKRILLKLPTITEDRFIEAISSLQFSGKIIINEGIVYVNEIV